MTEKQLIEENLSDAKDILTFYDIQKCLIRVCDGRFQSLMPEATSSQLPIYEIQYERKFGTIDGKMVNCSFDLKS